MAFLGLLITIVCGYFLFTLPRKWAPLPMMIAATYMTAGQALDVAGLNFTVIRIVALIGLLRVTFKRERVAGGWQTMDRLVAVWGVWVVVSAVFHKDVGSTLIFRSGFVFDNVVIYFLFRVFMRNAEEFLQLCKVLIIVLAPLAALMLWEKLAGANWFAFLGGVSPEVNVRGGKIRAQGPFAHPILAGTIGAACLPLAIFLWRSNRSLVFVGAAASLALVYASASSGPIMTMLTVLFGLALWLVRGQLRTIRWSAVGLVCILSVVMQAPVYYLIARIDLTGGSTGWHRAALIEVSIKHLGEWWFAGTDYTRHWMPTGVHWNKDHTDITNHYIQMGVMGGLPLMFLFMAILAAAFAAVGRALRRNRRAPLERQFLIWTLGAILFGHATTFISVTYFDQSIVYVWFLLAAIGSLHIVKPAKAKTPAPAPAGSSGTSPHQDAAKPSPA